MTQETKITHIALLRGINVGGHKKILMADLRKLMEQSGFSNVNTYIQTGNIVFTSNKKLNNIALASHIAQAVHVAYGFDVPVMVRTVYEFEDIIKQNPYLKNNTNDIERLHLVLLSESPSGALLSNLKKSNYQPDQFEVLDTSIYLSCTLRYQDTKLGNNIFEKKLNVKATTRNWKTTIKIWELTQNKS